MNQLEFILIIVELIYLVWWILNIIHFHKKKQEQKTDFIKNIYYTSIFFAFLPIQMIDLLFLDAISLDYFGYKISTGYGLAMLFSGFGNFYFLSFAQLVFGNEDDTKAKRKRILYLIIELCATSGILITKLLNEQTLAYVFLGLHLLAALYLGAFISKNTIQLARKVEKKTEKVSLICMSVAGISMLSSYIFFLIEGFVSPTAVSWLGIIGWIFAVFISFTMYIGYTSPKWFRQLFEE